MSAPSLLLSHLARRGVLLSSAPIPSLVRTSAIRSFSTTHPTLNVNPPTQPQPSKERSGPRHPDGSYLLFHPTYTRADLDSVRIVHRDSKTFGDKVARTMCTAARTVFDFATRYPDHNGVKFPPLKEDVQKTVAPPTTPSLSRSRNNPASAQMEPMTLSEMRRAGLCFGPDAWLNRIIFLETIAGVPGMVAATCRHLQSLRLMKRDKGWIHTLLEDAENERMHLLTFMELAKPGPIARTFALLAQGVFYNFFFLFYLFSPRVAHRFVGVLEEEAVITYSNILEDLKEGRLPEWQNVPAPEIAKQYWQLQDNAMLVDVIRAVRADEATHRHINHTFASLESDDPNPFALREPPARMRAETYGLERQEALAWAKGKEMGDGNSAASAAEKTA